MPDQNTNAMTRVSFRLYEEEKKELEALAAKEDLTVSQIIRRACRDYLQNYKTYKEN